MPDDMNGSARIYFSDFLSTSSAAFPLKSSGCFCLNSFNAAFRRGIAFLSSSSILSALKELGFSGRLLSSKGRSGFSWFMDCELRAIAHFFLLAPSFSLKRELPAGYLFFFCASDASFILRRTSSRAMGLAFSCTCLRSLKKIYGRPFSFNALARFISSSFDTGLPFLSRRAQRASALSVKKGFSRLLSALACVFGIKGFQFHFGAINNISVKDTVSKGNEKGFSIKKQAQQYLQKSVTIKPGFDDPLDDFKEYMH